MVEEDQPQGAGRDQPLSAPQTGLESAPVAYAWVPPWIARHFRGGSVRARMAKGVAWNVAAGVASRGLFVLISIVIARMLGKEDFGKWGMAQATVGAFAVLAGMGIGQTLTKHLAELRRIDPPRAGRLFCLGLELASASNLLVGLTCLLLSGVIARSLFNRPDMVAPVALSAVTILTTGLLTSLQSSIAGFEAFRQLALVGVLEAVLTFVAMLVFTKAFGLLGAIGGFACGQAVSILVYSFLLGGHFREHRIPLRPRESFKETAMVWQYSLPLLLSGLVLAPASWFPLTMVARQSGGMLGMAAYTASHRWASVVGFLPRNIRSVALPLLSQLEGDKDVRRYRKALLANLAATVAAGLLVALPIAVFSRWVLSLYGPEYAGDWDILVVLVGASVFQGVLGIYTQCFISRGKAWWAFLADSTWCGLIIVGALMLVPGLGVRGVAWSTLGAYALEVVVQSVVIWRLLPSEAGLGSG